MAHSLQLTTVAEGVETAEQLACLHQHGCEEVQGFLLSRPLPADALLALLGDPGGLLEPAVSTGGELSRAERDLLGLVAQTTRPADGSDRVRPVLRELCRVTGAGFVYLSEVHWEELTQEVRFLAEHVGERTPMPAPPARPDRTLLTIPDTGGCPATLQ